MQDKNKALLFLTFVPFVTAFFVMLTVILHVENLPDPLNVMTILSLSFGPPSLMMWYWLNRFYFTRRVYG